MWHHGCALATLLVLAAVAAPEAQAKARFHQVTAAVQRDGDLVVRFRESGVGNRNVTIRVTADVNAQFACVNRSGQESSAQDRARTAGPTTESENYRTGRNGHVSGTITLEPGMDRARLRPACPPGHDQTLVRITYSNVRITDTSTGATARVRGTFTRAFDTR